MKYFSLVLIMVSTAFTGYAQNIGIGTALPTVKLHVQTTDTALLQLENTASLSLSSNNGLYFKNGSFYTGALKAIGNGVNTARLGLFTYADASANGLKERLSILDHGLVGINNANPTAGQLHVTSNVNIRPAAYFDNSNGGGKALGVNGGVQLSGIGEGAGKVLTSDAAGNASWQAPNVVAFRASIGASHTLMKNTTYSPTNMIIMLNEGSAFNATNGEFTAPVAGVYQFSIRTSITLPEDGNVLLIAELLLNGADFNGATSPYSIAQANSVAATFPETKEVSYSLKLVAGDKVRMIYRSSFISQVGLHLWGGPVNFPCMFSGFKL
ncbi:MAG: hypothetical protein EOO03_05410 [Chitinophagaceae bacterium]|nr:MAG: hypothetical protein EOO03_05410 [Chitinophagaceae bacterium]